MSEEFQHCCPHCHGTDFQPVELSLSGNQWFKQGKCDWWGNEGEWFPYNGEELYHCNYCGTVFQESVELRLLEPVVV